MKKSITFLAILLAVLFSAPYALAVDSNIAGVSQVQTFITNGIKVLTLFAGTISGGFFTWGGYGYITSSGNPEGLERSKRTIMYSAIGLSITSGAYILTNIVEQLAQQAGFTAVN